MVVHKQTSEVKGKCLTFMESNSAIITSSSYFMVTIKAWEVYLYTL